MLVGRLSKNWTRPLRTCFAASCCGSKAPCGWRGGKAFAACGRRSSSSSGIGLGSNKGDDGGGSDIVHCLLKDRYMFNYDSWPSEEHAAFAFARLAGHGRSTIELDEFVSVLQQMGLDYNLSHVELGRVFRSLDHNGDGHLSLEEFKAGRVSSPFTKALVETLSGTGTAGGEEEAASAFPDPDFDWESSTAEFYRAPLEDGFVGENVSIRKSLDYSYHGNFTHKRQRFQDMLIRKNVLLDGSGNDRPWLVHTCGRMGAGKGWVLGWMSAGGILPLERVCKIDPDSFKLRMPEWSTYQRHSVEAAGTRTHAESSYIAEIAQRVAMRNAMNVWVDGSLRNYKWHRTELKRIRRQHPHYRIAIVAIDAPEAMIEVNLKRRAKETGRHVPEELRRASAVGIDTGLKELTHLVDLVAHVSNESGRDSEDASEPKLKSVSMIDSSGNWELIKELTSS